MPNISDAIGTFFEEKLLASLPGIKDFRDCDNAPDFKWGDAWIEAKVAFRATDYGILPKEYQFLLHDRFAPFIYACGYHDFESAMTRLKQKTFKGMVRHLHRNAAVDRVVFVSAAAIERIYERDVKTSKKEGRVYCAIGPRDFQRIITDDTLKRAGRSHHARDYYGIHDYVFTDAQPIGFILTKKDHDLLAPMLENVIHDELFTSTPF